MAGPATPENKFSGLGFFPFRSPLLRESRLISSPPLTEMFHFSGSRFQFLCIQNWILEYYSQWVTPFGHFRVKAFFQLTGTFRRLRVLHRLSIPRHPPAALNNLTEIYKINFGVQLALVNLSVFFRLLQAPIEISK